MKRTMMAITTAAVLGLSLIIWSGCSEDSTTTSSSDDWTASYAVSPYLPLVRGFTSIYAVTYANGSESMIRLEIGRQVQANGVSVVEWISDDGTVLDTGYVRATDDAVYFYDGLITEAEKILDYPLEAGHTWLRFSDSNDGDDFTDIITGYDDTSSTDDGTNAKVFPSTGENLMTVLGREQLELSDGSLFVNAVKVYNENAASGKKNYYWFVQNVGLVKYVLGATDNHYPNGEIVGELIDYGN
ncbi:MAG: hypothetical protein JSU74_11920 [Candidatus Zixiibacteriota bacterium]|nr:MAG: hypothetical protein JSU74_11920 [candidate division Zixibacteria bacterium]